MKIKGVDRFQCSLGTFRGSLFYLFLVKVKSFDISERFCLWILDLCSYCTVPWTFLTKFYNNKNWLNCLTTILYARIKRYQTVCVFESPLRFRRRQYRRDRLSIFRGVKYWSKAGFYLFFIFKPTSMLGIWHWEKNKGIPFML